MLCIEGPTANDVWLDAAGRLQQVGSVQESRDQPTRELLHVAFTIADPRQRLVFARPMNPAFAIAEVLWLLAGANDADFLAFWNPQMRRFLDGSSHRLYGAYGHRLGSRPKLDPTTARDMRGTATTRLDQIYAAYEALKHTRHSRQVVLQIWDSALDLPNPEPRSKDIPCSLCSHLLVRDGRLEWLQVMRSNDLIWGTPYNFFQWTCVQEIMAGWLGLDVGPYNHISDSLHVYKRHWPELNSEEFYTAPIPVNRADLRVTSYEAWSGLWSRLVIAAFGEWLAVLTPEALRRRLCWLLCSSDHQLRGVDTTRSSTVRPPYEHLSTRVEERAGYAANSVRPTTLYRTATSLAEATISMLIRLAHGIQRLMRASCHLLQTRFIAWTRPPHPGLVRRVAVDSVRGKAELIAENALLRQQLIVLQPQDKRPHFNRLDRLLLVLLASRLRTWRRTLVLVQPETLLRWHRQGFRLVWKATSARPSAQPPVSEETRSLITTMATENCLWGAERIRAELLKLGIRVSKRTVQKYMRRARPPQQQSQTWATFLHNHAHEIWACDFLQLTDLWFRSLFAFFIIELGSRKAVHVGVTRHPTNEWIAQQLREATPFGVRPRYLIRDNDSTDGSLLARVAATSRIEVLRTPVRAPRANAICERFLGSVRRECLDHVLIFHDRHLQRVLQEYVDYFNHARPHQGIDQAIPDISRRQTDGSKGSQTIVSLPILGGLHHDYRLAA